MKQKEDDNTSFHGNNVDSSEGKNSLSIDVLQTIT